MNRRATVSISQFLNFSIPLPGSQLGAAGPGILLPLLFAGLDRLGREHLPVLAIPKRLLHAPILQRVKADNYGSAARFEALRQKGQEPVERTQLIVHSDPERLENSRCRINRSSPAARSWHTTADQIGQLLGRFKGRFSPRLDNLAGDSPAEAFLTVLPKDVGQLSLAEPLH